MKPGSASGAGVRGVLFLDGPEPVEHPVPYEAVQPEIRLALELIELETDLSALHPTDFRDLDGQGLFLIRQDQTNQEGPLFRGRVGAFHRAAEHREVRYRPFADRLGIGKHCRIGYGQSVVLALVGTRLLHDEVQSSVGLGPWPIPRWRGRMSHAEGDVM